MTADHHGKFTAIQIDEGRTAKGKVCRMERALTIFVVGGLAIGASLYAQGGPLATKSAVRAETKTAGSPDIPPLPGGKSTIIGGRIRSVDAVRDQMVLQAYGEKPMKILFDERTQVYRDGKRIPLHDMGPVQHASVQTTLDGANVFAISVHILGESPRGDYQGRILSYDPATGLLVLTGNASSQPFRVVVSKEASIKRKGQEAFSKESGGPSDLMRGALVALTFEPSARGEGVADDITILATPGASFVFSGTVTALDVPAGYLVLTDPRDNRQYQIHFDPGSSGVPNLHQGQHLRVSADYDGTRYVAIDLSAQ